MTRSIDRALLAIVLSLFTLIATVTCSGVRPEPYVPLPALGGAPTGWSTPSTTGGAGTVPADRSGSLQNTSPPPAPSSSLIRRSQSNETPARHRCHVLGLVMPQP